MLAAGFPGIAPGRKIKLPHVLTYMPKCGKPKVISNSAHTKNGSYVFPSWFLGPLCVCLCVCVTFPHLLTAWSLILNVSARFVFA